jgi:hypothetical protein
VFNKADRIVPLSHSSLSSRHKDLFKEMQRQVSSLVSLPIWLKNATVLQALCCVRVPYIRVCVIAAFWAHLMPHEFLFYFPFPRPFCLSMEKWRIYRVMWMWKRLTLVRKAKICSGRFCAVSKSCVMGDCKWAPASRRLVPAVWRDFRTSVWIQVCYFLLWTL